MGEYKGEPVRIHVDESVGPVVQPHRCIPFHVRKQVEDKLKELENEDIIERAEGPTPWFSPIVVVPKPSSRMKSEFVLTCCPSTKLSSERGTSFLPLTMWCQISMDAEFLVRLILIKVTTRSLSTLIQDNSRHAPLMLNCFATSG